MTRIGIVTLYHKNYNYGGQMQAFAMQKIFSSINDCHAELISFETKSSSYFFKRLCDLGIKKSIERFQNKIIFKNLMRDTTFRDSINMKISRFDAFIDAIPHTDVYNENSINLVNNQFDVFVCGSDQIWNPGWWNDILFLQFTNKPKFSYAASIARTMLTKDELSFINNATNDYIGISVREEQAKVLLEKNLKKRVTLSLDPTLLIDRKQWMEMADYPDETEPYVLFYMVGDSKGLKRQVYEKCKKNGYKVYSIGFSKNTYYKSDIVYSDYVIKDAGPLQWLGWIANAKIVFTDSFHGSVFSILFYSNFWCFERDNPNDSLNENSRLYNFLKITGLESRLMGYEVEPKMEFDQPIDFISVDGKLTELREQSVSYINDCLQMVNR